MLKRALLFLTSGLIALALLLGCGDATEPAPANGVVVTLQQVAAAVPTVALAVTNHTDAPIYFGDTRPLMVYATLVTADGATLNLWSPDEALGLPVLLPLDPGETTRGQRALDRAWDPDGQEVAVPPGTHTVRVDFGYYLDGGTLPPVAVARSLAVRVP